MPVFSPDTPGLIQHTRTVAALGAAMFVGGLFGVYKGYQWLKPKTGQEVIVELRYDTVIRGVLESSDEALNLVITDATARPLQGKPVRHDFMFVKGSTIRYIHIPQSVRPGTAVEDHARRIAALRTKHAVGRGTEAPIPKGVPCTVDGHSGASVTDGVSVGHEVGTDNEEL